MRGVEADRVLDARDDERRAAGSCGAAAASGEERGEQKGGDRPVAKNDGRYLVLIVKVQLRVTTLPARSATRTATCTGPSA